MTRTYVRDGAEIYREEWANQAARLRARLGTAAGSE